MKKHKFLKDFFDGFKYLGLLISSFVNAVLLSIVYILGVGASNVLSKTSKKNLLDLKGDASSSYWSDIDKNTAPVEEYLRQF